MPAPTSALPPTTPGKAAVHSRVESRLSARARAPQQSSLARVTELGGGGGCHERAGKSRLDRLSGGLVVRLRGQRGAGRAYCRRVGRNGGRGALGADGAAGRAQAVVAAAAARRRRAAAAAAAAARAARALGKQPAQRRDDVARRLGPLLLQARHGQNLQKGTEAMIIARVRAAFAQRPPLPLQSSVRTSSTSRKMTTAKPRMRSHSRPPMGAVEKTCWMPGV